MSIGTAAPPAARGDPALDEQALVDLEFALLVGGADWDDVTEPPRRPVRRPRLGPSCAGRRLRAGRTQLRAGEPARRRLAGGLRQGRGPPGRP